MWQFRFRTWYNFFNDYLLKTSYIKRLSDVLKSEYSVKNIIPRKEDLFKSFRTTDYNKLKVVILCTEPYHNDRATGIALGNTEDLNFKECKELSEIEKFITYNLKDGLYFMDYSLENWCEQGVLLLDTSLTVEMNQPKSHFRIWGRFIKILLEGLSKEKTGIIYCLWGKQALVFEKYIDIKYNYILKCDHPSESIEKGVDWKCDNFKEINKILKENNGENECIRW